MSRLVLDVIVWALIPAGLLPVLTAWVLRRYRHAASAALRDRWHLALVLALLGASASLIAALVVSDVGGGWAWIPFGLALLAVDVVSGKWLIEFWRGRFR